MTHIEVVEIDGDKIRCKAGDFNSISLQWPTDPPLKHFWRQGVKRSLLRERVLSGDYIDHPQYNGLSEGKVQVVTRYKGDVKGKMAPTSRERERRRWVKKYMDVKMKVRWNHDDPETTDVDGEMLNLLYKKHYHELEHRVKDMIGSSDGGGSPIHPYSVMAKSMMQYANDKSPIGIAYVKKITNDSVDIVVGKNSEIRTNFDQYVKKTDKKGDKTSKKDAIGPDDMVALLDMITELEELEFIDEITEIDFEVR